MTAAMNTGCFALTSCIVSIAHGNIGSCYVQSVCQQSLHGTLSSSLAQKCEEGGFRRYLFGFGSCRSRNGDDVDVAVVPAFLDQTEMPLKCNDLLALHSSHNKGHQTFYN